MSDVYSVAGLDDRVIQVSDDNVITYANSAFCGSVNLSREEVIGSPLEKFDHFDFGDGVLQDLVEQEREQSEPVDHESSYVEPESGETQHVRLSAHPNAEGVQVLIEDRSDQYQMEQAFQRYVGPQMLERIKDADPDVFDIPERRPVTALFSDLRNFTSISRELKPDQVREVLNVHFDTMIPIINDHQGMIDKLMGDGIMALFGAPLRIDDHSIRAVRCALEMMRTQKQLIREWSTDEIQMPPCGIGIQTGQAIVGDVGSSKQRDFTAVGPPINLAARLCGAAKPDQILTTEQVIEEIRTQAKKTGFPLDLEENGEVEDPGSQEDYGGKTGDVEASPKKGTKLSGAQFSFLHLDQIHVKGFDEAVQLISVEEGDEYEETGQVDTEYGSESTSDGTSDDSIRVFDDYELYEKLGRGGMGVVYRAKHQQLGRVVALKMLLGGEEADEQQVARFEQETRASAMLNHPNIVSIHEFGKAEGYPYFTMDYVDGKTLSEVIDQYGGVESRGKQSSLLSSWVGGVRSAISGASSGISVARGASELFSSFMGSVSSKISNLREDFSEKSFVEFVKSSFQAGYELTTKFFTATTRWVKRYTLDVDWAELFRNILHWFKDKLVAGYSWSSEVLSTAWNKVTSWAFLKSSLGNVISGLNDFFWSTQEKLVNAWDDKKWYEPILEAGRKIIVFPKTLTVGIIKRFRGTDSEPAVSGSIVDSGSDLLQESVPGMERSVFPQMELPEGGHTAESGISRDVVDGSELSIEQRVRICSKVLDALGYAHDKGLVHRDVKPSNIMIDDQGEPVLMDFGLAHVAQDDFESLTQSGALIGTTAYMAPEQARGEVDDVDERTDVYAMGAVLYEMLAGRPAFEPSGNQFKDLERIAKEDPPNLQSLNPSVPDELALIVQKAMNKEKDRRYASPFAFKEDLRRFLDNEPITARPPSLVYSIKKSIMRHPGVSATAAASLVLLIGLATYFIININRQKNLALQNMQLAQYQSHLLQGNNYFSNQQWTNAFQEFAVADRQSQGWQSQLRLGQIVNKSWPVLLRASTPNNIEEGMILPGSGEGRFLLVTDQGRFIIYGESGEEIATRDIGSVPDELKISPDNNFIVAGFSGASLYVFRRTNLEVVTTKNLSGKTLDFTVGSENKLAVVTRQDTEYTANVLDLPLLENHKNYVVDDPGEDPNISYTAAGNVEIVGSKNTVKWGVGSWNLFSSATSTLDENCQGCVSENHVYFDGQRRVEVTWKAPTENRDPAIEIERDPSVQISTPRQEWYDRNFWLTDSELSRVQELDFARRNDESWLVTLQGRSGVEVWEIDRNAQRVLYARVDNLMPHREIQPSLLDSTAEYPSSLVATDTSVYMLAVPGNAHQKTYRDLPERYSHVVTTDQSLFGVNKRELIERRFGGEVIRRYKYPNSLRKKLQSGIQAAGVWPGTGKLLFLLGDRLIVLDPSKAYEGPTQTRVPIGLKRYDLKPKSVVNEWKLDFDYGSEGRFNGFLVSEDNSSLLLANDTGKMVSLSLETGDTTTTNLISENSDRQSIVSLDRNQKFTAVVYETEDKDRLIVRPNNSLFSSGDTVFERRFEDVTTVRLTDDDQGRVFVGLENFGTDIWNFQQGTKLSEIRSIEAPERIVSSGELLFGLSSDPGLDYSVYSIDRDKYLLRSPWPAVETGSQGIFSDNAKTVGVRNTSGKVHYLRLRSAEEARKVLTRPTGIPSTSMLKTKINRGHVNINTATSDELKALSDHRANIHKLITDTREDIGGFVDVDELNAAFFESVEHTQRMRPEVTVGPDLIKGRYYPEFTDEF